MAKTANDYIVDGARLYRANGERPEGGSWQANAMREGFDVEKQRDKEEVALVAHSQSLGDLLREKHTVKPNKLGAVLNHIETLIAEATRADCPVGRAQRLMNKVNALRAKWQKRGIVHSYS